MNWGLRWRLSLLWFLQFAIWGAWFTYVAVYLKGIEFTADQRGVLFASMGAGLWFGPLLAGQLADRWLPTQWCLALFHLIGAGLLWCLATYRDFWILLLVAPLYAMVYVPSWALASSLSFRHLPDRDRQFGGVRMWGTVGWVMAGWAIGEWFSLAEPERAAWKDAVVEFLTGTFNWTPKPEGADCFRLAALLSLATGIFSFFLPHTPPHPRSRGKIAAAELMKTFRDGHLRFFIAVAFVLAMVVPFYFLEIANVLKALGYSDSAIPKVQTLGQASEVPSLLLLPLCLHWFGLRATFALGIVAWIVRFAALALASAAAPQSAATATGAVAGATMPPEGGPFWLLLFAISLHGVCHVFILIVAQLYVDRRCRADLRGSAQNLLAFLTLGVALPAGFVLAGLVNAQFGGDYSGFFLVPTVLLSVVLLAFLLGFRDLREAKVESEK